MGPLSEYVGEGNTEHLEEEVAVPGPTPHFVPLHHPCSTPPSSFQPCLCAAFGKFYSFLIDLCIINGPILIWRNQNQLLFSLYIALLYMGNQWAKIRSELCWQREWHLHLSSVTVALSAHFPFLWLTCAPVCLVANRSVCHPESSQVTYHILSVLGSLIKDTPEASVRSSHHLCSEVPMAPKLLVLRCQSRGLRNERGQCSRGWTASRVYPKFSLARWARLIMQDLPGQVH